MSKPESMFSQTASDSITGSESVFRGRLLGGPIPEAGKLLALQAKTSRGWRTFSTPRVKLEDGKFTASLSIYIDAGHDAIFLSRRGS